MGELVVYTTDEVVARLKVSPRWFREFLKKHPYYREAGRAKLFTEADIKRLYEAMTCRSSQYHHDLGRHPSGISGVRSADESIASLRRRETRKLLSDLRSSSS